MQGVPQKDYSDDFRKIPDMNGSVFCRFIEKGGMIYIQLDSAKAKK
jgi:hypothetical protein